MVMHLLATLLLAVSAFHVWASSACADGKDTCSAPGDDPSLAQLRQAKIHRAQSRNESGPPGDEPFPIYPCDLSNTESGTCPEDTCSDVAAESCDAPGWVFCINAKCATAAMDPKYGKLVSKCECWQPSNTNFSIVPVRKNSGANCVMKSGPGGSEMCEAIKNGALISTFGPTGDMKTPLLSLQSANCAPHTLWAWCWGAPCSKVSGKLICDCPVMKSTNDANQSVSLAGKAECAGDPCNEGIHNSMPAGTSPASHEKSAPAPCYSY